MPIFKKEENELKIDWGRRNGFQHCKLVLLGRQKLKRLVVFFLVPIILVTVIHFENIVRNSYFYFWWKMYEGVAENIQKVEPISKINNEVTENCSCDEHSREESQKEIQSPDSQQEV